MSAPDLALLVFSAFYGPLLVVTAIAVYVSTLGPARRGASWLERRARSTAFWMVVPPFVAAGIVLMLAAVMSAPAQGLASGPAVTLTKTTTTHFTQAGATLSRYIDSSSDQLTLFSNLSPSTAMSIGPLMPFVDGDGAHAIESAIGEFLIIHGEKQKVSSVLSEITATTLVGPTFSDSGGTPIAVGKGAFSIARGDGTFLLIVGGDTDVQPDPLPAPQMRPLATQVITPAASLGGTWTAAPGPNLSGTSGAGLGAHAIKFTVLGVNKFLIVHAGGGVAGTPNTSLYTPPQCQNGVGTPPTCTGAGTFVEESMVAGPAFASNKKAGKGAVSIPRNDLTFLVVLGGGANDTQIYTRPTLGTCADTTAACIGSFAVGPSLGNAADDGTFAIQYRQCTPQPNCVGPDRYAIVRGGSNSAVVYDPAAAPNAGILGSLSIPAPLPARGGGKVGSGAAGFLRPDGTVVGFYGSQETLAFVFTPGVSATPPDLANNGAFTALNLTNTVPMDRGSFVLHQNDGRMLIFAGSAVETRYNDAGWALTGTYESEPINAGNVDQWTSISWTRGADDLTLEWRAAKAKDLLANATYAKVNTSSGPTGTVGATTLTVAAAPADTTLTVVSTSGMVAGQVVPISSGANRVEVVIKTVTSATVLTLQAAVGGAFTYPIGAVVGMTAPANKWIQVRVSFKRADAASTGAQTSVWLGSSSVVQRRALSSAAPVLSDYSLGYTAGVFVLSARSPETAGVGFPLTVELRDSANARIVDYQGNHTLTFAGASVAPDGQSKPTIRDRAGADVAFGQPTGLTFGSTGLGIGTATRRATLYKKEEIDVTATETVTEPGPFVAFKLSTHTMTTATAAHLVASAAGPSATKSTLVAAPAVVKPNGTDASTLTLTITDAFGNILPGLQATLVSDRGSDATTLTVQALPADTTLTVVSTSRFAVGQVIPLQSGSNRTEVKIKTVTSATVLTLAAAVGGAFTYPVGASVGGVDTFSRTTLPPSDFSGKSTATLTSTTRGVANVTATVLGPPTDVAIPQRFFGTTGTALTVFRAGPVGSTLWEAPKTAPGSAVLTTTMGYGTAVGSRQIVPGTPNSTAGSPAGVADGFLASVNMKATAYTLTNTTLPTGYSARRVTISHTAAGAADTLGSAALVGTDEAGNAQTESVVLVTSGVAYGLKAFKTLTSVTTASWVIAAGNDTITVGFADGATNKGWRDESYARASQATTAGRLSGDWTFTYSLALTTGTQPVTAQMTVVAYAVTAGNTAREMFRNTTTDLSVGPAELNHTQTFTPSYAVLNGVAGYLAAGEILQYEFFLNVSQNPNASSGSVVRFRAGSAEMSPAPLAPPDIQAGAISDLPNTIQQTALTPATKVSFFGGQVPITLSKTTASHFASVPPGSGVTTSAAGIALSAGPLTGTYETEALNPGNVDHWDRVAWTKTSDGTVTVSARVATTQVGLSSAAYVDLAAAQAASGSASINGAVGSRWVQVKLTLARTLPSESPLVTSISLDYLSGNYSVSATATQTAGTANVATITMRDQANTVITDFAGPHTLVLAGANAAPDSTQPKATTPTSAGLTTVNFGSATALTFASGSATTTLTLYKAETVSMTASETVLASTGSAYDLTAYTIDVNAPASVVVSAAAVSAAKSSATTSPASVPADNATVSTISVRVKDQFENPVAGLTTIKLGSFQSVAGDRAGLDTLTNPATTDATGLGNGTIRSTRSGTVTIKVKAPTGAATTLTSPAAPGATSLALAPTSGIRVGDVVTLKSGANDADVTVATVPDATTLTLTAPLGGAFTYPSGSTVTGFVALPSVNVTFGPASFQVRVRIATTVTSSAAPTATSLSVASSTGFQAADTITLTSGANTTNVTVASVPNATTITLTTAVGGSFTYPIGTVVSRTSASGPLVAGMAFQLELTAKDGSGATVTSYAGSKTIAFTTTAQPRTTPVAGPSAIVTTPQLVTFTAGVATTSAGTGSACNQPGTTPCAFTLYNTAQTPTITATDGAFPTGTSAPITVVPAAPSLTVSTFVADPLVVAADNKDTSNLTVQVMDAFGNPISGKTVTFSSSRGGSDEFLQPPGPTGADGVAVGQLRSLTVGTPTVSAAITGSGTLTTTRVINFVQPGGATRLLLIRTQNVGQETAGVAFSITIIGIQADGTQDKTFCGASSCSITITNTATAAPDGTAPTGTLTKQGPNFVNGQYTTNANDGNLITFYRANQQPAPIITVTVTSPKASIIGVTPLLVQPASVNLTKSYVYAVPDLVPADGTSTATLGAKVLDTWKNPITGKSVTFASSRGVSDVVVQPTAPSGGLGIVFGTISSSVATDPSKPANGPQGVATITGTVTGVGPIATTGTPPPPPVTVTFFGSPGGGRVQNGTSPGAVVNGTPTDFTLAIVARDLEGLELPTDTIVNWAVRGQGDGTFTTTATTSGASTPVHATQFTARRAGTVTITGGYVIPTGRVGAGTQVAVDLTFKIVSQFDVKATTTEGKVVTARVEWDGTTLRTLSWVTTGP